MLNKLSANGLFVSGIVILCTSILLYHLDPVTIIANNVGDWLYLFGYTLIVQKPLVLLGVLVSSLLFVKAVRR